MLIYGYMLFFLGPLYPIAGTKSPLIDDGSSPQILLERPFVYFGQPHNQIYVCKIIFVKYIPLKDFILWRNASFCFRYRGVKQVAVNILSYIQYIILIKYCTIEC